MSLQSQSFQNPNSLYEDQSRKYVRITHEDAPKVRGIKALTSPSIYIIAVIFAFACYHIDRRYDLYNLLARKKAEVESLKEPLQAVREESQPFGSVSIFVLAVSIVCLVLAVKKVMDKRR